MFGPILFCFPWNGVTLFLHSVLFFWFCSCSLSSLFLVVLLFFSALAFVYSLLCFFLSWSWSWGQIQGQMGINSFPNTSWCRPKQYSQHNHVVSHFHRRPCSRQEDSLDPSITKEIFLFHSSSSAVNSTGTCCGPWTHRALGEGEMEDKLGQKLMGKTESVYFYITSRFWEPEIPRKSNEHKSRYGSSFFHLHQQNHHSAMPHH